MLSTVLYLIAGTDAPREKAVTVGIAGAALLWMAWWYGLHPGWRVRSGLMTVFFLGVLAFYAALGLRDPMFGFYSFAGYVYAAEVLPGWRKVAGVLVNALLATVALYGGLPNADPASIVVFLAVAAFFGTIAITFTMVGYITSEQSRRRKEMVAQLAAMVKENAGLHASLAEVAGGWTDQTGVPATVSTTGAARALHPEVEVTLLRAAQEALSNVAKHASASRVGLTLSYMEDVVTLDVRDDGAGFDPARDTTGYGLVGMRQRVSRLAGSLAVESEPGSGTAVSASVPAIPAEVAR